MSSQKRNIIIGVVLILAACVLLFAIKGVNAKKTTEKKTAESQKSLYQYSDETVNTYMISSDSEKITLKKGSDTNWHIDGNENVDLIQLSIDQAVEYLKELQYTQKIENGSQRLADFGLDRAITVEAVSDSGKSMKVTVGNATIDNSGYYIMKDGDPNVYVVDADCGKALSYAPSSFRNRYPQYVDYSNIDHINITRKNGKSFKIEPNPTGEITDGYGEYLLTGAYSFSVPVLTDKLADNIGGPLYEIVAADFIDNPQSDSYYGFDDPQLVCETVDKSGNQCTITIGNDADDKTVYAKFSGKDYVCTVLKEKTDKILNTNLFDIIGKHFVNESADSFSRIAFSTGASNSEIDINNGKETLNGKDMSSESFKNVFTLISNITMDGEADESKAKAEVFAITLTKADGTDEYKFLQYDDNYYAVERNGKTEFVTGQNNIKKLMDAVK